MQGITFIGMAGAGKSAVGQVLAVNIGWKFLDLDKMILESTGVTHDEFMKQNGEGSLKKLEEELALSLNLRDTVFAPPGSMVYSERVMEKVGAESLVIYLKTTHDIIEKRLGERLYKNGIVGLKEKGLAGVMAERIPLYERYAHRTFETGEQSKEEMAATVLEGLRLIGFFTPHAFSQHQ